jgi:hypothetical protein
MAKNKSFLIYNPCSSFKYVLLMGVILLLQACASPIYYARQVHGQVVDDETEKPLEGVIVLAEWILLRKGLGESWNDQKLRVFETVTDQNGNYVIPGSPMIRLAPFTELHSPQDPQISFFKKGYTLLSVNNFSLGQKSGVIRKSLWNGKVLRLKLFKGSKERYATFLRALSRRDSDREWRHVPRLLKAMYEEKKRLVSEGLEPWLLSLPDINDVFIKEILEGDLNEE